MVYATGEQLATWLYGPGADISVLPQDHDRLLARASTVIDDVLLTATYDVDAAGNPTSAPVVSALADATCAQVEFWLTGDEEDDILGPLQSVVTGGQQLQMGSGPTRTTPMYLAPRAARVLRVAGLLSGAVR